MRRSDKSRLMLLRVLRMYVHQADPAKMVTYDPGAYETATLAMGRALFGGASAEEAIAVLDDEWGRTEGTSLSHRRLRRLRKDVKPLVRYFHERGLTDRP